MIDANLGTWNYSYDGDGNRVKGAVGGTIFFFPPKPSTNLR